MMKDSATEKETLVRRYIVIFSGAMIVVLCMLLSFGVGSYRSWKYTELLDVFAYNDRHRLVELLDSGLDANHCPNGAGTTLLHFAVLYNKPGLAQLLIERGADISARLGSESSKIELISTKASQYPLAGATPLVFSAWCHSDKVGLVILRHGPDINAVDGWGNSALSYAAEGGDLTMVSALLDAGCEVDGQDRIFAESALMRAASRGHVRICEKLLESGASIDLTDDFGRTAIDRAILSGHGELATLIGEYRTLHDAE